MKKANLFLLLAFLTLCACTVAAQGDSASASIGRGQLKNQQVKFTSYKLANGLRVLLAPDSAASGAAVNISFNAGSGKESPEQAGLANLIQSLVLQNLRQELGSELKPFEGVVNQERASYFSEFTASQLDFILSALARQMRPPDINQSFIDEQRVAAQDQCRQLDKGRFGRVQETLLELIYQDSAFKYGAVCSPPNSNQLSPERAKSFFKTYYVPNNAVMVIVGNFRKDDAKKTVAKHFGTISRRAVPANTGVDKQQFSLERRKILSNSRANAATYMSAYLTVPSDHPDWYAMNILADIIGQGDTSRLHTALVARNLAASVPEGVAESRGQSLFRIGAALLPVVSVGRAEAIIDAEITRIQNEGVT